MFILVQFLIRKAEIWIVELWRLILNSAESKYSCELVMLIHSKIWCYKVWIFVPKVIITKICRLHNQLFACNDFCGQRATTIYCGPAYKF
jgi:hypothetical protein